MGADEEGVWRTYSWIWGFVPHVQGTTKPWLMIQRRFPDAPAPPPMTGKWVRPTSLQWYTLLPGA